MWRRAPKAVRSSRALLPDALTPATLVALVLDPPRRRALLAALGREHGSSVTLRNAYERAARRADATPDDLARVVAVLEAEGEVEALRAFVWHPSMPETVLLDLCERGVCVTELGHRAGPRSLIRRVAELHAYAEAILTLALDLYRDPTEPAEAFAAHARAHATHEWMLRTLAEVNGSDPEKEAIYEALLGASPDAAAYRARHLARSPGASTERLAPGSVAADSAPSNGARRCGQARARLAGGSGADRFGRDRRGARATACVRGGEWGHARAGARRGALRGGGSRGVARAGWQSADAAGDPR